MTKNRRWKYLGLALVITLFLLSSYYFQPLVFAESRAGTSLEVTKTAQTNFIQLTQWDIGKTVTPTSVDLFNGDSIGAQWKISATKTVSQIYQVNGKICVENEGLVDTQNLVIVDNIQSKTGWGKYQNIPGATQTIIPSKQIAAGKTQCYSYSIKFNPIPHATYRNEADATITNHSGHIGTPFTTAYRIDLRFPSSPQLQGPSSITVSDTNGQSFPFSATGSQTYTKSYTCNTDSGSHSNTATIAQTGQTSTASITVNCNDLQVTKDASTSFTRTWTWQIGKTGEAKTSASVPTIHYTVSLTPNSVDSSFAASGNIKVHNPAPIAAIINSVSDIVSGPVTGTVDCGLVSFPYTLASGADLSCTYSVDLPNQNSKTNTATATLQNHSIDSSGGSTSTGTTDFTGMASVSFGSIPSTETDECVSVSDHSSFTGSTTSLGTFCAADASHSTNYDLEVGIAGCGTADVTNTATFTTNDGGKTGSDTVTLSNSGIDGGALCVPWREFKNPPD